MIKLPKIYKNVYEDVRVCASYSHRVVVYELTAPNGHVSKVAYVAGSTSLSQMSEKESAKLAEQQILSGNDVICRGDSSHEKIEIRGDKWDQLLSQLLGCSSSSDLEQSPPSSTSTESEEESFSANTVNQMFRSIHKKSKEN